MIGPLSKNLRGTLYQRLADRGVVRAERGRIFGVFPIRRQRGRYQPQLHSGQDLDHAYLAVTCRPATANAPTARSAESAICLVRARTPPTQ